MSSLRIVRNPWNPGSSASREQGEHKANIVIELPLLDKIAPTCGHDFVWISPKWCSVVNRLGNDKVNATKGDAKRMKAESAAAIRASISFPPEMYETLEVIAKEKKVSLAWVVREAAERYIAEKWPLFSKRT
jgi:hypothetical protein